MALEWPALFEHGARAQGRQRPSTIMLPTGRKIWMDDSRIEACKKMYNDPRWTGIERELLRYVREADLPELLWSNLKQFLCLKATFNDRNNSESGKPLFAPQSPSVDKCWHRFLLGNSYLYMTTCEALLGGMIHHVQTNDMEWQKAATVNTLDTLYTIVWPDARCVGVRSLRSAIGAHERSLPKRPSTSSEWASEEQSLAKRPRTSSGVKVSMCG